MKPQVRHRGSMRGVEEHARLTDVCRVKDCGKTTTWQKPYCIEHLDLIPYVQEIRREIASPTMLEGDVLFCIQYGGAQTIGSISKDVRARITVVEKVVRRLVKKGLLRQVRICGVKRTITVVVLGEA